MIPFNIRLSKGLHREHFIMSTFGHARRLMKIVADFTALIIVVVMIVLPGPAVVVIHTCSITKSLPLIWSSNDRFASH